MFELIGHRPFFCSMWLDGENFSYTKLLIVQSLNSLNGFSYWSIGNAVVNNAHHNVGLTIAKPFHCGYSHAAGQYSV